MSKVLLDPFDTSKQIDSPDELPWDQYPWFIERMMQDTWVFGLLVTGNLVIVIDRINRIHQHGGIVWLDVTLWPETDLSMRTESLDLMFSPTEDRTTASIRADSVIAAFELADT